VLGAYPEGSLESAKSRHEFARNLLAQGTNPSALKATLGKHAFVLKIQEWETARGHPYQGVCLARLKPLEFSDGKPKCLEVEC
jgi:hypothetical protein